MIIANLDSGYHYSVVKMYNIIMKLLTQSATILLSCSLILAILNTPLTSYTAPILGIIIIFSIIFIVIKQRSKKSQDLFTGAPHEVATVLIALLLAVFLTGGLGSNLYFLLYFLLFGIVFLFEPATVFVLLVGLLVIFYQSLFEGDMVSNLIKLGSLIFLAPISYFFGREFRRREKLESEIQDKTAQILEDAQVLKENVKDEELIDEIEDIEEKASDLKRD